MEAKVYDMIARRFVAVFYPAAEFDVTTRITTVAPEHNFKTEGKVAEKVCLRNGRMELNTLSWEPEAKVESCRS